MIALAMLDGCSYRPSPATAIVGAVGTVASIGGTWYCLTSCFDETSRPQAGPVLVVIVGLAFARIMIRGLEEPTSAPAKSPDEVRREQEMQRAEKTRERVLDLTTSARAAAHAGNCAAVQRRGATVLELDPTFHATVFVRDADIQRCLAQAGSAATTAGPKR